MTPRFSILTPTRNRPDWLPRCVASVLTQTFEDWEQIILDNGDQPTVLPDDSRIRYIREDADGPADAFNRALGYATGEIVHPLSDDDRLPPDALELADREIGDADWLHGLTSFEDHRGNVRFNLGGPLDLGRLRQEYYLGGAIYWRRSLTDRLGSFDATFDGAADYDLYLRFAAHATAVYVPEVMYRYTDHPGTDSHMRRDNQMAQTAAIKTKAKEAA